MKDVIIKCDKGEVNKTLAYIEKKNRNVRWKCYLIEVKGLEKV